MMIVRVFIAALLCIGTAGAAEREDIEFVVASSLPPDIWDALAKGNSYSVVSRINPFYLQGDFDHDGFRDTAVLVKERKSGKHGVAVVFKGGKVRIVGAGKATGGGTDNLDWMDAWYVEPAGQLQQGATGESPPRLKSDGLMVIKTESASAVIYWDGSQFRFYQQGD